MAEQAPEYEETELLIQRKNTYLEKLKNLHPSVYPQLIKLYSYLQDMGMSSSIIETQVDRLSKFEPIAFMNMKLVSLVIQYNLDFNRDSTLESLELYLESKYREIILEGAYTLDVDKKLTPEFKRNAKINFASYLIKLKPIHQNPI